MIEITIGVLCIGFYCFVVGISLLCYSEVFLYLGFALIGCGILLGIIDFLTYLGITADYVTILNNTPIPWGL
jgi:hypothetical protein